MKTSIRIAALIALTLTTAPALTFETDVERVGMLYFSVPLSNRTSAPTIDKSVMGFRFGQTRLSTDRAGSLFTYFRTRPALFDVQFGLVGRKYAPDDVHFGLLDLKLTGISSVEKTYINGQAIVGSVIASKVLVGVAAIGGIGVAAAASGGGGDSSSTTSHDTSETPTTPDTTSHDVSTSHESSDDASDDASDDSSDVSSDVSSDDASDDSSDVSSDDTSDDSSDSSSSS